MCSGCGSGKKVKKNGNGSAPLPAHAVPGEDGFTWLEYIGPDVQTEYGPVTGARYPFQAANPRYVDRRDAEKMKQNSPERFVERVYA